MRFLWDVFLLGKNYEFLHWIFHRETSVQSKQETGELKSQVLRLRGDLSRLEKAFESRDMEDGHRVVD